MSCTTFVRTSGTAAYKYNTILVRIPTEKELTEKHNLAVNTYDIDGDATAFPHATGQSVNDNTGASQARNAIDGFTANGGTGAWPYQSFVPAANGALKIDFGRNVRVDTLCVKLRAAASDTHPLSAVLTFSDGSKRTVDLFDSDDFIEIDLGGKVVSSLELGSFETALDGKFALTEVRVIGSDIL